MKAAIPEIESLSKEEVQPILQSIADSLLPKPGEDQSPMGEREQKVLDGISRHLELSNSEWKRSDRAKLLQFVFDQIAAPHLKSDNIRDIRARLGDRGALAPSLYRIAFHPSLLQTSERAGLNKWLILSSIRSPSAYQHLSPQDFGHETRQFPSISLFASVHQRTKHRRKPFVILVKCVRETDVMTVWDAWRLYSDDVKMPVSAAPIDLLRAFIEKFGASFRMDEGRAQKLVIYDVIELREPGKLILTYVDQPKEWSLQTGFIRSDTTRSAYQVSFYYIIRMETYLHALAAHGVKVDLSPPTEFEKKLESTPVMPLD